MKKLILGISLVVLFVAGCSNDSTDGGKDSSKKENVDVTIWATNINVPVLERAAELYKEDHPEFNLNVEEMNNDDIRSKMTAGLQSAGQGLPDGALLVDDGITGYVTNFSDTFANITELGFDEHEDQFPQYKMDSVSYEGDMYAIPFDAGPVGVFYRADLFEEAGVNAEDIKTWNDYFEAGEKIKEVTGANMLSFDSNDSTVYTILMSQQGKGYFEQDGTSNMDSEVSIETASVFSEMAERDIIFRAPGWNAWVASLVDSQTATAITGAWLIGTLEQQVPDQSGNWAVMPLPSFEGSDSRSANQGGSSFSIFESSDNKEELYDFLVFFATSTEVQELAMEGGLFPSYLPVYESDLFAEPVEYFNNEPVWEFFAEEMTKIPSVFYTEHDSLGRDEAVKVQAEVLEGTDPEQSVSDANGRIENRIN